MNLNPKNKIIEIKRNKPLRIFNLEFIFSFLLNFKENKGIGAIKKNGIINAVKVIKYVLSNIGNNNVFARGIDAKKMAIAGVGRPIN